MIFQAVLFDCGRVLVDSEPITVRDERTRIEQETGLPLTDEWMAHFYAIRNHELSAHLKLIKGAVEPAEKVHQRFAGRFACASGADRFKFNLQLDKVGLTPFFALRLYSGQEQARNKPAPDVYLAAATGLQVYPAKCLVVEDSATGITAGVAAGATGIDFAPTTDSHPNANTLRQAGAITIINHMADLPAAIAHIQTISSN